MTIDVRERVRRAIDDIIDPATELGPCPTPGATEVTLRRDGPANSRSRWSPSAGPAHTTGVRRFAAAAAGLLLVVGSAALVLREQQREPATTSSSGLLDLGPVERFPVGSVTFVDEPPLFVVHDASTGILVLDARSTHLGCVVVLDDPETAAELGAGIDESNVREFIDPCHGSEYDRAGNKLGGPAPRGLDSYPFEVVDQRLVVDLTKPILGESANPPNFSAADLDLSLPIVGRAWPDSLEFSLDRETNARLFAASQLAVANCMRASGFPDHQPAAYAENAGFEDLVNPLDRRYASVMGYSELPATAVDPNVHTEASAAAEAECANDLFDDVWGRFSDYFDINDRLRNGLFTAIDFAGSEAGRTAGGEWSACMAERGHDYGSRSDASNEFSGGPVTAREIETRLDDLDCDITVGYTQRQHDWERARIETWRLDNAAAIALAVEQKRLLEAELPTIEAEFHGAQD